MTQSEARMPETKATAVKERPIMFSMESVKAILEGRKSETRRVINPQPPEGFHHNGRILWESMGPKPPPGAAGFRFGKVSEEEQDRRKGLALDGKRYYGQGCPFGGVGTVLWVREPWMVGHPTGENKEFSVLCPSGATDRDGKVFYRASFKEPDPEKEGRLVWRSPRHMPRWASRLLLSVEDVRVERLQEISENDAEAEGVEQAIEVTPGRVPPGRVGHRTGYGRSFRQGYRELWDSLNAKRGFPWKSNCWVWCVTFQRTS